VNSSLSKAETYYIIAWSTEVDWIISLHYLIFLHVILLICYPVEVASFLN
jgi:hypothetical protein